MLHILLTSIAFFLSTREYPLFQLYKSRERVDQLPILHKGAFVTLPPIPTKRTVEELQNYERELIALKKPFPCRDYLSKGLDGIAFSVLNITGDGSEMCFLGGVPGQKIPIPDEEKSYEIAGDDCSFNAIVQYMAKVNEESEPAKGMYLAILGYLLFTPTRLPPVVIPSQVILEQPMVIVRRRNYSSNLDVGPGIRSAWSAVTDPFTLGAWTLLLCAILCYAILTFTVSFFRPTPVFSLPVDSSRRLRVHLALWAENVVRNTVGGKVDEANLLVVDFEPARTCFRAAFGFLILVTLLYFEAALVIGNKPPSLKGKMAGQSDDRLCSWSVIGDSAVEESMAVIFNYSRDDQKKIDIWNPIDGITLNRSQLPKERRWNTCETHDVCLQQLVNMTQVDDLERDKDNTYCNPSAARVDFIASYETVVHAIFKKKPLYCELLEVVATEDKLQRFMSGFMFAPMLDETGRLLRLGIDRNILRARRQQDTTRVIEEKLGVKLACPVQNTQVSATLIAFPVVIAVALPSLLGIFLTWVYPVLRKWGGPQHAS